MAKYLIHSCNSRQWYVDEYLIPSMLEQGINREDISVYQDVNNDGCLESCMQSFSKLPKDGGTWHLQDDVCIADNFKELTEKYDDNIVCGICTAFDKGKLTGEVSTINMLWYSFPCIRIPNSVARDCATWFYNEARYDGRYTYFIQHKKDDDLLFRYYLVNHEPFVAYNLTPNIVQHIDYLIGGSTLNADRIVKTNAVYWTDEKSVHILEEKLKLREKLNSQGGV